MEKAILMNEKEIKIKKIYTEAETYILKMLKEENIIKNG